MNIQGFQKMTLLDFPGKVACIVFTGGCNLRCPFCHNGSLVRRPAENKDMENEVFQYLQKRRGIVDGVVITGGEPLLQPGLADFISKIKEMGYDVKLDTNGALPEKLKAILATGNVDYVAMDIKSSPEGYQKASGSDIDIENFQKSVDIIKQSGIDHEFRTTVVKGIHEAEDLLEIARWIGKGEKYFLQKYVDSGDILGSGCEKFSDSEYGDMLKNVRELIPEAQLRG